MAVRIAVLASGGGTNLQAIIDFNAARGNLAAGSIALVASNRAGAGALERARAASIPVEVFDSHDDGSALGDLLRQYDIELIVLAGYLRKIPPAVTSSYRGRIVNIHPGLLPEFGGPGMYGEKVHSAVIASGSKVTGVTAHFVDDEIDGGPVIAQWQIRVREDETPISLAGKVLEVEHCFYPRIVDLVASLMNRGFPADF